MGSQTGLPEPFYGEEQRVLVSHSAGPAPHIGHANHLCDMAERGEVTLAQMKEMVKDPKFICKKCGRVAAKEENLCEPVPL